MTDDFAARAEGLDETPARDHALVVSMAGLQAVPVVGGIIATFIGDYVPRAKQRRLVSFVRDLGRAFEEERDRIHTEFVKTKDFARMVEDVLDRVQTVRYEEKVRYWASLLAGVAAIDRPNPTDRERMVQTLDDVRSEHLRLLHVIATTTEARPGLSIGGVSDTLSWKMPDVSNDEARHLWAELARTGVVQGYPSATMTREGAGNLTVRLTPYGREFVRLLKLEVAQAIPERAGDVIGQRPRVVRVPTFRVQATAPPLEAVFGTRPAAGDGPDAYSTSGPAALTRRCTSRRPTRG